MQRPVRTRSACPTPRRTRAATAAAAVACAVVTAASLGTAPHSLANTAAEVIQYMPGTGAAPGYDQTAAVLGEPSRITPGQFGGPVDPFSPPWQPGQLLSLGTGGSLTIRFAAPIRDDPAHPYGLDFLLFGGAGFMITNGDFTGGGITDGSLFGSSESITSLSVSSDGVNFFGLDRFAIPRPDALFPTDGSGDFTRPVNPALQAADFNGLDLAGIRVAYDGSGGGAGYDIAWARTTAGRPAFLQEIQYVRIDVLSDRVELDAFMAVPEPAPAALLALGGVITLAARSRRPRP